MTNTQESPVDHFRAGDRITVEAIIVGISDSLLVDFGTKITIHPGNVIAVDPLKIADHLPKLGIGDRIYNNFLEETGVILANDEDSLFVRTDTGRTIWAASTCERMAS